MGNPEFIVAYVSACTRGALGVGDCGPVWQLGVIVALLLAAVVALVILRLRREPAAGQIAG
jgi:hypothetical protein